jgi:hypothetical protein
MDRVFTINESIGILEYCISEETGMMQLNVRKEGEDIGGCLGDVYAVLK